MRAAVTAFTGNGSRLAAEILKGLRMDGWEAAAWIPEKYAWPSMEADGCLPMDGTLHQWMAGRLSEGTRAFVFIGACGIAVRAVAPFLCSKAKDPAVVAVDERGIHAVALLSGHMGGANRLTERIAAQIGAHPVITTATDLHGLFAADEFAGRNGLYVSDWTLAKECAARLLKGERLGFYSRFPVEGEMPSCLFWAKEGEADIAVDIGAKQAGVRRTLFLVPPAVTLGAGCRRGTAEEALEQAFSAFLKASGIFKEAVSALASIDLKKEEPGLLAFARRHSLPFYTYKSGELASLKGEFSSSEFVKRVTGVDNVCERAALCGGGALEGETPYLLCGKYAREGVTLAAACRDWRICFG